MEGSLTASAKERPQRAVLYWMHALGRAALPERIESGDRSFTLAEFIKHDFFAATGFYRDVDSGELVVLKMSRTEPIFGVPMRWLGRLICWRELRFYKRLEGIPNVPAVVGRVGRTGFLHAYVPGQPLAKGLAIPDTFFDDVMTLIDTIAERGVAIVDTNKPENILLGDDGKPHLIDFQISYDVRDFAGLWPSGVLLRLLRRTDRYHLLKHKRRLRPDLLTPQELAAAEYRPWIIRLHRKLTRPYFLLRRRLFAHLRATGRLMPEGSK